MPKKQDAKEFIGVKYNRLIITKDIGFDHNQHRKVMAVCDCGVSKEYVLSAIKTGTTKSCGCIKAERGKTWKKTHGLSRHPLHRIWVGIKQRCYNPKNDNYPNYGGLGVIMCDEWLNDFEAFYTWCIQNGWEKGMQIDKDLLVNTINGKIYSPEYCSIVTAKKNLSKTRLSKMVVYKDVKKTLMEWSIELGLNYSAVNKRITRGWSAQKAFEVPIQIKN